MSRAGTTRLTDEERAKIWKLKEQDGLDNRDIAKRLGRGPGTICMELHRQLKAMNSEDLGKLCASSGVSVSMTRLITKELARRASELHEEAA